MSDLEFEGKWNQFKGAAKQKFGDWFGDDETETDGKFDEVVGKIQEKTGKTIDEIKDTLKSWIVSEEEKSNQNKD